MSIAPQIPSGMEHCADVFAGVYDVPLEFDQPVTILDIGANVGAFALWACKRWNVAAIHCYEPFPSNYARLTLTALSRSPIRAIAAGVGRASASASMRPGAHNCGEASMHDIGEQRMDADAVAVNIIDAASLPLAQLLKIDTEGCEVEILERLRDCGRIGGFLAVMVEYHSEADRRAIDALLVDYVVAGSHSARLERGVVRYIHRDLMPAKVLTSGA